MFISLFALYHQLLASHKTICINRLLSVVAIATLTGLHQYCQFREHLLSYLLSSAATFRPTLSTLTSNISFHPITAANSTVSMAAIIGGVGLTCWLGLVQMEREMFGLPKVCYAFRSTIY